MDIHSLNLLGDVLDISRSRTKARWKFRFPVQMSHLVAATISKTMPLGVSQINVIHNNTFSFSTELFKPLHF